MSPRAGNGNPGEVGHGSREARPLHLPLVGREDDLTEFRAVLARAREGSSAFLVLHGEPGVGKSRLLTVVADEARRGGWALAAGRAFALETGVPYALLSDALVPLLREMEPARLSLLTRGSEARLTQLFPALRVGERTRPDGVVYPAADRAELFWTFTEVLRGMSARTPLLLLLDDLHWADPSTLELLHFTARQVKQSPLVILASVNDAERERHPTLGVTIQSLASLGALEQRKLGPLSHDDTDRLVRAAFGIDERVSRQFSALLFGWTRGNPYFIEETLKVLLESGQLRQSGGGWVGWEASHLELPSTVRDAIRQRLARLSSAAQHVAELVAVMGGRARYDVLLDIPGLAEPELVAAIEELSAANVLSEGGSARAPSYDFQHPLLTETLLSDIALARRRMMHRTLADALERRYGERVLEHADELARHYALGGSRDPSPKAVLYLEAAGQAALARFADLEAADYFTAALEQMDARRGEDTGPAAGSGEAAGGRARLLGYLARAKERAGNFQLAIGLWEEAREAAAAQGDHERLARVLARMALAQLRSGRHADAVPTCDQALEAALRVGARGQAAAIRMIRGTSLHALGRIADALADLKAALEDAELTGDLALQARSHRALLVYHGLAGPSGAAREHGARALALAEQSRGRALTSACHWGLAVLEGLTGHAAECDHHMGECVRIAHELGSPLLRLAADEIQVEHAFGRGDWDTGIALGERAIADARAFNQKSLLPRLLVWTAFIYVGRNDQERARRYLDEAWELSGAQHPDRASDLHSVIPAHIGFANYHMARGELTEALRVGRIALAIVERAGYKAWAVHRLLPILAEVQLHMGDVPSARSTLERLRKEATDLGHPLGLAWADGGDAIAEFLAGDMPKSIGMLRAALERLDAIPYVPDAARLRRQLAGQLTHLGERDEAIRELRKAWDVFSRLGAVVELEKARKQFQDLDARPPARSAGAGLEGLTARELEIVRLIAARKPNKAIGKALGISPRTVGTHLSNIFAKLELTSRHELADRAPLLLSRVEHPS